MDANKISLFVIGTPRTAGSKKAFRDKAGTVHLTHDGQYTKAWMDKVSWFALKKVGRMCLLNEALLLRLTFYMQRPQAHFGTGRNAGVLKEWAIIAEHTKKPDLTKLTRAVEDALTGVIWKDDSQVARQETSKQYCDNDGQKPGVLIEVETLERKE